MAFWIALHLVRLALQLQLGVTDRLADHLLDRTSDLLPRSDDPVFSITTQILR